MLKETVCFTLVGCAKEELLLTVETHVHRFGKTRVGVDYAGAAKPRDFEWPDEAKAYIEELMAAWEGPPIEGLGELLSELEQLNERSRERWQEAHAAATAEVNELEEVR
ncbi:MAG: hypothetical protein QME41_06730 [Actinomycetota bacterium]|nr:hypothetical protein [Actinomycetota bacterium]